MAVNFVAAWYAQEANFESQGIVKQMLFKTLEATQILAKKE